MTTMAVTTPASSTTIGFAAATRPAVVLRLDLTVPADFLAKP